jgi:hypothetical protein
VAVITRVSYARRESPPKVHLRTNASEVVFDAKDVNQL